MLDGKEFNHVDGMFSFRHLLFHSYKSRAQFWSLQFPPAQVMRVVVQEKRCTRTLWSDRQKIH